MNHSVLESMLVVTVEQVVGFMAESLKEIDRLTELLRDSLADKYALSVTNEKLENRVKELELDLSNAQKEIERFQVEIAMKSELLNDASESVQEWGNYADEYFKEKYQLSEDVKKYSDASKINVELSAEWIAKRDASILELAADKFDGTTGYNWVAADGYANALDIASELRYMASEYIKGIA